MELERFKSTVVPLREKLQNYARSMLKNETDAEDAVQEAFLRLWNARSQLDTHPNIGGFSMQTLKHICIDRLRNERYDIPLDNVNIGESSPTPYTYTEQNDSVAIVRCIIDALPETQKRVMLMRDIDGYELAEIAEIMGTEPATVRVNLSRARKAVRDRLINMNTKL